MRGSIQADIAAATSAYMMWWELAGVDYAATETAVDWRRPVAGRSPLVNAPILPPEAPAARPATLHAFQAWLVEDPDQPERRWPGLPIVPEGTAGARLMVITDMPDPADMTANTLLADQAGLLFDAMLAAIGLSRAEIYLVSLFLSRPPGGMVEATDLALAADRMRTHVTLAAPRQILLLGDRTVRTFFPTTARVGMDFLQYFNHDGGTVPALATFHPRLLMGQPAAKAESWRTLQRLVEEQQQ